jgi:general secretion pathway protein K
MSRHIGRARGAAIITALFVVAMSALLVSGLLWRQQVQIRRIENQRQLAQGQWVVRGAIDWTRLVLRASGDTAPVDYLGGVWAVPVAETRLSDFLGRFGGSGGGGEATWLSGSVEDAQAKFNLRNLIGGSGTPGDLAPNLAQIQGFQRLLGALGMNSQLAGAAANRIRASLREVAAREMRALAGGPANGGSGNSGGGGAFTDSPGLADTDDNADARPLPMMLSIDSLRDVPGFTPAVVERLRPFVTLLPVPTPVNIDTAPAEVFVALIPQLSLAQAQVIVAERQRAFFLNQADFQNRLKKLGEQLNPDSDEMAVKTSFFILHGRVRHDRVELAVDTLIYRDAATNSTRVVAVQDAI